MNYGEKMEAQTNKSKQTENIEKIKYLWEKEYQKRKVDSNKIKNITSKWKEQYKDKIIKKELKLDEYTNTLNTEGVTSYLTYFLERESEYCGYSRGGNSFQYMISKNNIDNKNNYKPGTYYIVKDLLDNGDKDKEEATKEEAEKVFKDKLIPLLHKATEVDSIQKAVDFEKQDIYKIFKAKQILLKIVVLNSLVSNEDDFKHNFLFIFKDTVIDNLYKYFISDEENNSGYLEKNAEIFKKIKEILGISVSDCTSEVIRKISDMLWDFEHSKDFVDEENPNVIYYGAPGTGKTYTVRKNILIACQGNTSRYEWVQFHPSYTYEDFIEGIKPTGITENGSVKLELVNGIFKELCIRAKNDPEHKYYFIADEINRANLSAVFGEVLSCIEPSYRDTNENHNLIKTQYSTIETKIINEQLETAKDDKKKEQIKKKVYFYDENTKETKFGIPSNVYFIGMMNDVDKSIDSFDLALRRRFKWIRKDCDTEVVRDFLNEEDIKEESIEKYIKSIVSLNKFISDELKLGKSYEFGHSFFMKITYNKKNKEIEDEHKKNLFENYLKPTLTEYLRSLYDNEEVLKTNLDIARDKFIKEE